MGAIQNAVNQMLALGGVATRASNVSAREKLSAATGNVEVAKEELKPARQKALEKAKEAGLVVPTEEELEQSDKIDTIKLEQAEKLASKGGILGMSKASKNLEKQSDKLREFKARYINLQQLSEEAIASAKEYQKAKIAQKQRIKGGK